MAEWSRDVVDVLWVLSWQIVVLTVFAWGISRVFGRRRPHFTSVLWMLVIAKALAPPVWSSSFNLWSLLPAISEEQEATTASPPLVQTVASNHEPIEAAGTLQLPVVATKASEPFPIEETPTAPISVEPFVESNPDVSVHWSWTVVVTSVWLAGIVVCAAFNGVRLLHFRRRLAACRESAELSEAINEMRRRLAVSRNVLARVSDDLGPATCGMFRPVVVVPHRLMSSLPEEHFDAILAHELTHIRRHDVALGWVQAIAQIVWWFHPGVWFANRQLTESIERACDQETVAALGGRPERYARALVEVIACIQVDSTATAAGVRPFHATADRVRRVLECRGRVTRRMPRWCLLVFVIGLGTVLPGVSGQEEPPANQAETTTITAATPDTTQTPANSGTQTSSFLSPDGKSIAYGQVAVEANGQQSVRIIVGNADGAERRALPIEANSVDEVIWYGNDRIAYVTEHGQDGYFLISLAGRPSGELRMPGGCDSFFHQCLSPDGRKIAFCGNYFETDEEFEGEEDRRKFLKAHSEIEPQRGLFVVDLETQSVKHLLEETVANIPAWSPDSKQIACGVGHYVQNYPLVVIDVETGDVQWPDATGVGVQWSPDASGLAMTTNIIRGGSWRRGVPLDGALGVWDLRSAALSVVSPPPTNVSVQEPRSWSYSGASAPVWSRDGKWIAYTWGEHFQRTGQERTAKEEVHVVRADGMNQRKVLNHPVEQLAWSADGAELLWVHQGKFGRTRLDSPVAENSPSLEQPTGRWKIQGKVTDEQGNAVAGAAIRVARGHGTLESTEPVYTDSQGRYEIVFDPGVGIAGTGPKLQAATVHVSKAGFYEKDLCASGNLGMAEYRPADQNGSGFAGIVYPGHPYELDFVLMRAARVNVSLVNAGGQPLKGYNLDLNGRDLYPSTSVLKVQTTDATGQATFEGTPLRPYAFSLGAGRAEYAAEVYSFDVPGDYVFKLVYDDIAGTLTAECTTQP